MDGRPGDLRVMYTETVEEVSAFVARRVRADEVEDLVADTYVRAFGALGEYDEQGAFIGWLITIARNVVYNHTAKSSRRRAIQPEWADQRTAASVSEHVEERDDRERVSKSLDRMRPADRQLLELRFIDGVSAAETGERLGLSAGAVRTASYRALKTLRSDFVAHGGSLA